MREFNFRKTTFGDMFNRSADRAMNRHFPNPNASNTSSWASSNNSSSSWGQKQSPVSPVSSPLNKNAPSTPWNPTSNSVIQQFDVSMLDK